MPKKTSMYCFCDTAHTRFTGGYLTTPSSDVIEISLKFEKTNKDSTKQQQTQPQRGNLNFVELSERTLRDVCENDSIHDCIKDLLQRILIKKSSDDIPHHLTPSPLMTNVTVHQQQSPAIFMNDDDIYIDFSSGGESIKRTNSSKRSSMKSSKSMETVLEKLLSRHQKDKSPDESKAKSVGNINDDDENQNDVGDYENGESIELIFISDEFVNKVNKQEVIVLDEKDGKRRESLTNKKKLVIITDDYKDKVLRNNSIVITNERKMLKKLKQPSKTYNTNSNSFLSYDEPDANDTIFMEDKLLGDKKSQQNNDE